MKKILIYILNENKNKILIRSIRVTPDFIGIGKKGQINQQEFRNFANDLEPNCIAIEITNL